MAVAANFMVTGEAGQGVPSPLTITRFSFEQLFPNAEQYLRD